MIESGYPLRLIMHDVMYVPHDEPSDSEAIRATFSKYYDENCEKCGMFTQLYGWKGTLELSTDIISDSDYFIDSQILKQQEFLPERMLLFGAKIFSVNNVFDNRYKVVLDCLKIKNSAVDNLFF